MAIANPNDIPATVTITRRSRNGNFMDSSVQIIPAMGQISKFVSQIGRPLDFVEYEGSLEIRSNVSIVVLALETTGDAENFNFSTIPVTPIQ